MIFWWTNSHVDSDQNVITINNFGKITSSPKIKTKKMIRRENWEIVTNQKEIGWRKDSKLIGFFVFDISSFCLSSAQVGSPLNEMTILVPHEMIFAKLNIKQTINIKLN